MLEVRQLHCVREHRVLFSQLSFAVNANELLLIKGQNGSGKSSLLRLLTGLSTAEHGEIDWQGQSIQHLGADYRRELHYVGHPNGIKLGLTIVENLRLVKQLSADDIITTEEIVLEHLQLATDRNKLAKYLSAGQKRRLALAKLLLLPRRLWILDEPFTALDAQTQTLVSSLLESHVLAGGIAIVSTHQPLHFTQLQPRTLELGT